jgi:hypothetical protein
LHSSEKAKQESTVHPVNCYTGLLPSTLTPLRMSEPTRSSAPPLGTRNEPGIRGDVSRPLCDIVGLDLGVGATDEVGVGRVGEEGGEIESDAGELLPTSSPTASVGERSSTDGLLLGIGDSQGFCFCFCRESSGGRTLSSGSRTDRRSSPFRTSVTVPCPSDPDATSSVWVATLRPTSSTTTERKAEEEEGEGEEGACSAPADHWIIVPLVEWSRCGGQGRLSVLRLRLLRAGRVKFSIQLSPWTAAFSVAEKQLGQHGRRGIVTRGVEGSEDEKARV